MILIIPGYLVSHFSNFSILDYKLNNINDNILDKDIIIDIKEYKLFQMLNPNYIPTDIRLSLTNIDEFIAFLIISNHKLISATQETIIDFYSITKFYLKYKDHSLELLNIIIKKIEECISLNPNNYIIEKYVA
jgi:hypothetical protein